LINVNLLELPLASVKGLKLARGEKNIGCGQNVLTSNYYFLEPITSGR